MSSLVGLPDLDRLGDAARRGLAPFRAGDKRKGERDLLRGGEALRGERERRGDLRGEGERELAPLAGDLERRGEGERDLLGEREDFLGERDLRYGDLLGDLLRGRWPTFLSRPASQSILSFLPSRLYP